jgi:hypothetical protein
MADVSQNFVKLIITNSGQKDACTVRSYPRKITIAELKVNQQI